MTFLVMPGRAQVEEGPEQILSCCLRVWTAL